MPVDVFLVFAKARAAASVKVDFILQLVMEKFNLTNPEAPKKEKVVLNKYERKLNLPSRHRKSVTFDLLSVENPALFANVTESVAFFLPYFSLTRAGSNVSSCKGSAVATP